MMKEYPGRVIRVVDTLAASFGEGIFALKASVMRKAKASLQAAGDWAEGNKRRMCQFFTVDDLMFLSKGGRISSLTARIGSIANIKPLLTGSPEGKIVSCGK
ncbi:MAG: DegV family protein, partial [Prevotella sp.]|nr:DegV family protein [Prevotella sp.]